MQLKNELRKHYGKNVKIGSQSSFVWCNCITDEAFKDIEHESRVILKNHMKMLHMYRVKLKGLMSAKPSNKIERAKIEDRIEICKHGIEKYERLIATFKPLLDRKVKEVYPSVYENEIIILIYGEESGSFWSVNEYIYYKETGKKIKDEKI